MIGAAATGFGTGFSLILAIGAQNAFVLRQGILRAHVFWLCLFCALSDALLIIAGVAGFGWIVTLFPSLPWIMSLGGAGFLIVYGLLRLRAAFRGGERLEAEGESRGLWTTLAIAAAFTWLNPHVYLDTLGLIGAVSTSFAALPLKIAFGVGAVTASFVFFFSLGFGAQLLAPLMRKERAWMIFDLIVALVMFAIAASLIVGLH
jgi:L-lysine exporter family protein LysE/ArgO